MANELQTKPIDTIRAMLIKSKDQIAMALPKHLTADRIIRVAMTSIQRTPKLLECSPKSLIGAIIQSAQLGLEPDGVLGHAYLIPYGKEVTFIPGYKGLIDLARRSGQVVSIGSHVVYSNENFNLEFGFDETIKHKPLPPSQRGDRIGVYGIARLKDGSVHFEWLWAEEVEKIRKVSLNKTRGAGPWVDHEDEMWRKTGIRRLAKYLPLSAEFAKAAAVDEMHDAGIDTREMFDLGSDQPEQPEKPSIDKAFQDLAGSAEDATITEPENTNQTNTISELDTVLAEIDGFGIGAGPLTAYVIRAIKQNKTRGCWDLAEAVKIRDEIKKAKGGK